MIKKQNLWFLTLFSLILVLSVYYITMPNELLLSNKSNKEETVVKEKETKEEKPTVSIEESEVVSSLRINLDEERETKKKELETLLTISGITTEEKNNAYIELQEINKLTSQELDLEKKIKEKYNFPVFVSIKDKEITVVIDSDKHDTKLANDIMRLVQSNFEEKMFITIQFK